MPAPAYIILSNDGVVIRTHSTAIGGGLNPTNGTTDLESLINQGFQPIREVPLDGGRVLIVMSKP